MKNNSNSEEKVKLKTGAKGRPKEVVLKEGKEEKKKTNKKTTYEYEPTRYAGIFKKYKCTDGKRVSLMGYRVFVECGSEMQVDKNGIYVSKRKRQTRVVKTEKEARELKGSEYKNSIKDQAKPVTVEQVWDDLKYAKIWKEKNV